MRKNKVEEIITWKKMLEGRPKCYAYERGLCYPQLAQCCWDCDYLIQCIMNKEKNCKIYARVCGHIRHILEEICNSEEG